MPQAAPDDVTFALDGADGCIAGARHRTSEFLARARSAYGVPVPARAVDLAQLVVSELVTNALKYAPGPVLLRLGIADGALEIEVWDSDPTLPLARAADTGRVGQHGLEIVLAVVRGFEARREPVGKRITARLDLFDEVLPGLGRPDGRRGRRSQGE
ncbi:ATP-binding protein [Streptomyces arenae]|uniref:ATP-binding protein n=1 Tax=Streptomyces arenae TaxID=29301 RepID=UPI002659E5A4|nr:ATP-binding protein [Streptomyces arenae]MCG7206523.1 ATP-binding protein [Streptomyces arenae]